MKNVGEIGCCVGTAGDEVMRADIRALSIPSSCVAIVVLGLPNHCLHALRLYKSSMPVRSSGFITSCLNLHTQLRDPPKPAPRFVSSISTHAHSPPLSVTQLLLQRNEPRTVRGTDTRPSVLDGLVTDAKFG